jgi:hypothetical protein
LPSTTARAGCDAVTVMVGGVAVRTPPAAITTNIGIFMAAYS